MSLMEGGPFTCYRHEFTTEDPAEWNNHITDGDHFDEGESTCIDCGVGIKFSVPAVAYKEDGTKGIREKYALRCPDCQDKIGAVQVSKA